MPENRSSNWRTSAASPRSSPVHQSSLSAYALTEPEPCCGDLSKLAPRSSSAVRQSNSERKSDVILGDCGLHRFGPGDIVQLRGLHLLLERTIFREAVHELGQVPAEPLRL